MQNNQMTKQGQVDLIKDKMLEAIFVETGGRRENNRIAEICAKIAYTEIERYSLGSYNAGKAIGEMKSGVTANKIIIVVVAVAAMAAAAIVEIVR